MASDTAIRWRARPELRQRLIEINGSQHGFLQKTLDSIEQTDGRALELSYLSRIVNGKGTPTRKPSVPMWLMIALTRIAEEDLKLDRTTAVALSPRWFQIDGEE